VVKAARVNPADIRSSPPNIILREIFGVVAYFGRNAAPSAAAIHGIEFNNPICNDDKPPYVPMMPGKKKITEYTLTWWRKYTAIASQI
jgi:hypothetical protein